MKRQLLVALAGVSLLLPPLLAFIWGDRNDNVLYPHPALVFIPMIFFGLHWAALAIPTVLFFVWNPKLFHDDARVPIQSLALLVLVTLLSIFWFVFSWKDGLAFQGAKYNHVVLTLNVLWSVILWLMFVRSRQLKQSFQLSLVFHWLLFAWLAWYAFPFFGELI